MPPPREMVDLCTQIERAINAHRMYDVGHPTLEGFHTGLFERLASLSKDSFVLEIEANAMLSEGEVLWQDESPGAITQRLFLEGLQRLTFGGDLTLEEVVTLMGLWVQTQFSEPDPEHTFATRFWEADFQNIQAVTLDALALNEPESATMEGERTDQVLKEMSGVQGADGAGGMMGGKELVRVTQVFLGLDPDGIVDMSLEEVRRHTSEEQAGFLKPNEHEVRLFAEGFDMQPHEVLGRCVRALYSSSAVADPAGIENLRSTAVRMFTALVHAGTLGDAADLIEQAQAEEARRKKDLPLGSATLVEVLVRSLPLLVPTLDDVGRVEDAFRLLRHVPASAVEQLIPFLNGLQTQDGRHRLASLIRQKRPTQTQGLIECLAVGGAKVVREVLFIVNDLPPQIARPVYEAALRDAPPDVSRKAFRALEREQVRLMADLIHPLLQDPDPAIRREVMHLLVTAGYEGLVPELRQLLQTGLADEDEQAKALAALGRIGGDQAAEVLCEAFGLVRGELKIVCAMAMGRAGSEVSREVLEHHAERWLVNKKLKGTCEAALKRLDDARKAEQESEAVTVIPDMPSWPPPEPKKVNLEMEDQEEPAMGVIVEDPSELVSKEVPPRDKDYHGDQPPAVLGGLSGEVGAFTALPDFVATFSEYASIVEQAGGLTFGRKYGNYLVDAHSYPMRDRGEALGLFLRDKVAEGFAPQTHLMRRVGADDRLGTISQKELMQAYQELLDG